MPEQKEIEMSEIKGVTPLGIKIISILFFIFSLVLLYTSIFSFFSLNVQEAASKTPNLDLPSNFFDMVRFGSIIFSLVLIIFGIFLWKRANWARVSIIILSALGILFSFPTTVSFLLLGKSAVPLFLFNVVPLAFAMFVLFYFTFNKKVRLAFNSREVPKSTKIFTGIFILILILISFGMIGLLTSEKKESATNYSAEYKFVDNNVYENTHYKFRLTYPIGSMFSKNFSSGFVLRFFLPNGQVIANDQENIGMYIKEDSQDLGGFLQSQKDRYSKNGSMDIQETKFGGQKGYRMIFVSDYTVNKGTKEAYYFTVKDNILYMLNYFPVTDENLKVVDNVAKSFEFIN